MARISQAVKNICVPVKQVKRSGAAEEGKWTEHFTMSFFTLLKSDSDDVPLCLLQSYKFLSFVDLEWSQKINFYESSLFSYATHISQ